MQPKMHASVKEHHACELYDIGMDKNVRDPLA